MDVAEQTAGIASWCFAGHCKPIPGSCEKNLLFFTPVETPTEQSPVPLSRTSCVTDSPTALVVTRRAPRDGIRDGVARRAHYARAACRTRRHNRDGGEPRECYREAGFRIVKIRARRMRRAGFAMDWQTTGFLRDAGSQKRRKFLPKHCAVLSVLRASPGWPSFATRQTHAFDPGTDSRRSEKWLAITLALVLPALSRLDASW